MRQLSGLDAAFVYLETAEMPMHVGSLHILELPAGYKGRYVRDLRKHLAARLPAMPALRRRLWWMPLNLANPAWVDATPDLNQHVVEVKLPASARHEDALSVLEAQVGALHPVLLDRERPLWKMHVFEGLAPGPDGRKRVGLYTQLHHAAVDGQAAVALANILFDLTPVPRTLELRPSKRQRIFQLEMREMLRGALVNEVAQIARVVKALPDTVGTLTGAARKLMADSPLFGGRRRFSNVTLAPATPMNVSVGAGRAFAAVSLPLAEVRELARAHEATINDLVLMVCATALRRHLQKKRQLPRKSLIAAVPITLRQPGDTTSDNQASMSLVSLGTHIADPRRRLEHVKAATAAMKSTMGSVKSILPTDYPSMGVPWLIEAATALYGKARVADRIPQVANLVISNVPGPTVPLYLAGARVRTNHPTSIVVHGVALNITVQSFDASLDFGLMADARALPDVKDLARAIEVAFDDIRALMSPQEEADIPPTAVELVDRARKTLTGAVSGAVSGAVNSAVRASRLGEVRGAVEGIVGQAMGKALPKVAQGLVRAAAPRNAKARAAGRAEPEAAAPGRAAPKATRKASR